MSSKSTKIKDIAQQAQLGADVSEHFTGHFQAKQQINIALNTSRIERMTWNGAIATTK